MLNNNLDWVDEMEEKPLKKDKEVIKAVNKRQAWVSDGQKVGGNKKISDNIKVKEIKCKGKRCCGGLYILMPCIVEAFEWLRKHGGNRPIMINRGFSCLTHNRKIPNAAINSSHTQGYGLDIWSEFFTPVQLSKMALVNHNITGVGLYDSHVHIDTRPGKRRYWDSRSFS